MDKKLPKVNQQLLPLNGLKDNLQVKLWMEMLGLEAILKYSTLDQINVKKKDNGDIYW